MSICPVPPARVKATFTPPTPTPLPSPALRYENCGGGSTTIIPPGGGVTTVTVCCPQPGPQGPAGPAGGGLKYVGEWASGTEYHFESGDPVVTSIVKWNDVIYICTADNTADTNNEPGLGMDWAGSWDVFGEVKRLRWIGDWTESTQYYKNDVIRNSAGNLYVCIDNQMSGPGSEPGIALGWESNWTLLTAGGQLAGEEKSFFDELKDNVFDWMKDATVGDWLGALAIGAGIIWAGDKIIEAIFDTGEGDGQADSRFNGSPGYAGTVSAPTLPVVISSLMEFGGFPSQMVDVSLIPATPVNFTIDGALNVRTILAQLALTYQFDIVSSGSLVKFVPKYQSTARAMTMDDLGFVKDDTTGGVKYAAKRIQGIDLPRSVTLKYYSDAIDHNIFTQTSTLETYSEGQDTMLEVPFTLTDAQAKTITETVLINAHIEQQQFTFTTDYYNVDLEPSDVISIPLDSGTTTQVRIIEINETDDGLLEFTAARSDYNSYSYVASGQQAATPPAQTTQVVTSIGYSQALFLEVPPLNGNDGTTPRLKALIHGYNKPGWPGAIVYRSIDGGNSYSKIAQGSALSTFGLVAVAPSAPIDYRIWDTTTTITVQLKQGTLLSTSDVAVQNGKNWCVVGEEIVGFANATLIGENTYSLSRLLRGRVGSESKCSTHVANELFVILDDTLIDIPLTISDLGKTVKCKAVTIGSDISKATAVNVQPFGLNMRPWAPALLKAERQGNNDWVITWKERPRVNNSMMDFVEIGHDVDWAGYGIAVLEGETVKFSTTTTNTTLTYTAAQQVAHFGSVQSTLNISVTQMSKLLGGGYPAVL